jgi:hypothetical protein
MENLDPVIRKCHSSQGNEALNRRYEQNIESASLGTQLPDMGLGSLSPVIAKRIRSASNEALDCRHVYLQ